VHRNKVNDNKKPDQKQVEIVSCFISVVVLFLAVDVMFPKNPKIELDKGRANDDIKTSVFRDPAFKLTLFGTKK